MSPPFVATRGQGADLTLVKTANAVDAKPPIEQHRRRPGCEKQSGAPEHQERQKSHRHPQSVPRDIRLRREAQWFCHSLLPQLAYGSE
jgi:hypothetical protein